MTSRRSWIARVVAGVETQSDRPVTVYQRDIRDYASDVANAMTLIEMKEQELAAAHDQLKKSQQAFIDHCREINLPLDIEALEWGKFKPWSFEG